MNEVKKPRRSILYFYLILMMILLVINTMIAPMLAEQEIKEVDYGTFMTMTENKQIGSVQVETNKIIFTNKDGSQVYKTGRMDDPDMVNRLHESGAEFTSEIVEQMSPVAYFFLSWVLPIVIFILLGQYLSKKMMEKCRRSRGR